MKLVKRDVAVKDKRAGRRQVEVLYTRQVTESQASKQASSKTVVQKRRSAVFD